MLDCLSCSTRSQLNAHMSDSTLHYAIGLRGKDSSSRMGLKLSFLANKGEVAEDENYSYEKGFLLSGRLL
jgi:hypothetical protein